MIGAAEGLGLAFAELLSAVCSKLLLVDIQSDKLAEVTAQLSASVDIIPVEMDAGQTSSRPVLEDLIRAHQCRLVVFNAAYAPVHRFELHSSAELDQYLNLNCGTLLHLSHAFTKMKHSGQAGFLAMSSMAGLHGTQFVAAYGASKAFTWNLMEALDAEFKDRGFDFCSICAGPIDTPGFRRSKPEGITTGLSPMSPEEVAYHALKAIGNTARYTPGSMNRASLGVLTRLLPRRTSVKLVNRAMERMFGRNPVLNQTFKTTNQTDNQDPDNHS